MCAAIASQFARKRVAISNDRLVGIEDGKARFRWKDYRRGNQQKSMPPTPDEFIRRFLLHVLPPLLPLPRQSLPRADARSLPQLLAMPRPEPSDSVSPRIIATSTRKSL